ncbi:hypothetical protein [Cupriavidus sp. AcVe19-6a]|uniref:hypothetical protein n=1 Tax=Cupriavidus sp. AcVe19-6a TaxID=2821358 RepID=UPI001AE5E275|nr:hypothetical protein [Cupriavidus sp. AcVe19-6a]MBP0634608.1 hypothetical protein [Cupriavidus sp. AcVe19-6a]
MSIGLLAAIMAALLFITVLAALWRCSSHPYRMRYRRCAPQRQRATLCRPPLRRHG